MSGSRRMTVAELEALVGQTDDGTRHEIIDGELHASTQPHTRHQFTCSSVWFDLHRWNAHGPDGLADGRKNNRSAPKLGARQQDALYAALQSRPPDGGPGCWAAGIQHPPSRPSSRWTVAGLAEASRTRTMP